MEKLIIKFLLENHGKLPDNMSWYQLGKLFGVESPDVTRSVKDSMYERESIKKRTNDIWRQYKKENYHLGLNKKRLFYDIETTYNIISSFQVGRNLFINPSSIIDERKIICVSYKWEGDNKVHTIEWDFTDDGIIKGCDKNLVEQFLPILEEADELIGHNVDNYDTKFVLSRAIKHGFHTFPKFTSVDTLKVARKHFRFNSNKLDYIAEYLGLGNKLNHRGQALWDDIILKGCEDSMKEMVEYCEKDVTLTEEVFNKLKPYTEHKTHFGVVNGSSKCSCPECSSEEVVNIKTTFSKTGYIKRLMNCKECDFNFFVSNNEYIKFLKCQ